MMLIMSVILNIVLGMVIVKLTMTKVNTVIKVAKDGIEVAKRGLNEVESAKRTISKVRNEYDEINARRAAASRRTRRDYDVFS
jgi:hypothetical protein